MRDGCTTTSGYISLVLALDSYVAEHSDALVYPDRSV